MQGHVARLLIGHSSRYEIPNSLCYACVTVNNLIWRSLAHGSSRSPTVGQHRAQPGHTVPFLTTDDFGRPTVIHRTPSKSDSSSNGSSSGAPEVIDEVLPTRSRQGKSLPKSLRHEQSKHLSISESWSENHPDASSTSTSTFHDSMSYRRAQGHEPSALTQQPPSRQSKYDISGKSSATTGATLHRSVSPPSSSSSNASMLADVSETASAFSGKSRSHRATGDDNAQAALHPNPDPASFAPRPLGPASRDRMLTFRLLKAGTLRELELLLRDHPSPPNMIHLAATARQAVLLGSLPQPQETRELLDGQLLRMTEESTAAAVAASPAGRSPMTAAAGNRERDVVESQPYLADWTRVGNEAAGMQLSSDRGRVGDGLFDSGDESASSRGLSGIPTIQPESMTAPPLSRPLREVGDILWAYGKLQSKPPQRAWSTLLRPILLDPAAWQNLQPSSAMDRRQERQRPDSETAGEGEGKGKGAAIGRELSKVAVALARMRELDTDLWRMLARTAAVTAMEMSPRSLASTLWAFGSVRMTHGSLLTAAVHAMHRNIRDFNAQDLVCAMWSFSRLVLQLSSNAANSKAAAANAAARELLYGKMSDAVRRALQKRAFKATELITLIGVLNELAEHVPFQGPNSPQVSPRLLRAVSQAVRKNLSSLEVGALALAASAFQRLGPSDPALFKALAAAMALRLRHMEPRHLLRGTAALQAAGLNDQAFFAKVLEAAQSRLGFFKRHELLAMAELCISLAGVPTATTATSGHCSTIPNSNTDRSRGGHTFVDTTAAQAFVHAAVLHVVTAHSRGRRRNRVVDPVQDQTGQPAAVDRFSVEPGDATGGPGRSGEPLHLRHWHRLLRAAAAMGWADVDLASRAVDAVLQELQTTRLPWLNTVRMRAMAAAADPPDPAPLAEAAVCSEGADQQREDASGELGSEGYDTVAGDVVGVLYTATKLGLRQRVDVVEAVVRALLDAVRVVEEAAAVAPAPVRLLGQVSGRELLRARDVVALSPGALEELRVGLDYFSSMLWTLKHRRLRISAHILRQRLGLWEGPGIGGDVEGGRSDAQYDVQVERVGLV